MTPIGAQGRGEAQGPPRWPWLLLLLLIAGALVAVVTFWGGEGQKTTPQAQSTTTKPTTAAKTTPAPPAKTTTPAKVPPVPEKGPSDLVKLGPQTARSELQAKRKKPYGLDKSLDVVVRSDERIQVGDKVISMDELQRKLVVEQRGEVLERPLEGKGRISAWGVHLVRPGENLWDIHYRLLREYLKSRGVNLPPNADQPNPQGYSSGVGKILKFAEHMVGVYNLKTGKMSSNLNLLEPGQKVVVFNLSEIFEQLSKIDPHDLSGVMYDGRVLLFPAAKQTKEKKKGE